MTYFISRPSRRVALAAIAAATLPGVLASQAADRPLVTVHRDPNCGCCGGWVQHVEKSGFPVNVIGTSRLDEVKAKLGVPDDLAACHTAEVAGYVIEGHVPAVAIDRLLVEKPTARGLAVPGMPIGSPGMEGGRPEPYVVMLFGENGRRPYMRFVGEREV